MKLFLVIHIVSGFTSLFAGTAALFFKKGSAKHRKAGKIFTLSMILIGISALILSGYAWLFEAAAVKNTPPFLFLIAVFGLYQVLVGIRAGRRRPKAFTDLLLVVLGGVNAFYMVTSGQLILIVFGTIQGALVLQEIVRLLTNESPKSQLGRHIGNMLGAFIASCTAFLVVNFTISPYWMLWLLPTALLAPVIIFWNIKINKAEKPVESTL